MDKEKVFTEFGKLRDDKPKKAENKGFWDNVPVSRDKYIITEKVRGV